MRITIPPNILNKIVDETFVRNSRDRVLQASVRNMRDVSVRLDGNDAKGFPLDLQETKQLKVNHNISGYRGNIRHKQVEYALCQHGRSWRGFSTRF